MATLYFRRRSCEFKVRHETREEACEARRQLYAGGAKGKLDVYPCRYCSGFHVGHRPPRRLGK